MRKIIYSMSVSLDGFVETPDPSIDWVIVDEELHTFFNDQAREIGTSIYGRRMYELMTAFWPTEQAVRSELPYIAEYARIWKDTPKIVFSKTLEKVEWNSRLMRKVTAEEIAELKAQPGKDMDIGGPTLASAFIKLGLIDEYQLFVNPVVLGGGRPFFPPLRQPIKLRLLETRTFGSGVVYLRYQSDGKAL